VTTILANSVELGFIGRILLYKLVLIHGTFMGVHSTKQETGRKIT
jgi:hypothetical protein